MKASAVSSALLVVAGLLPCGRSEAIDLNEVLKEHAQLAQPVLAVHPEEVTITLNPDGQGSYRLVIENRGGQTLTWSARPISTRVVLLPTKGTLGHGGSESILLEVHLDTRSPGWTREIVVIEAPGAAGSPRQVPVLVHIQSTSPPPPNEAVQREPLPPPERHTEPVEATRFTRGDRWRFSVGIGGAGELDDLGRNTLRMHLQVRKGSHALAIHHGTGSIAQVEGVAMPTVSPYAGSLREGGPGVAYRRYGPSSRWFSEWFWQVGVTVFDMERSYLDQVTFLDRHMQDDGWYLTAGAGVTYRFDKGRSPWFYEFQCELLAGKELIALGGPDQFEDVEMGPVEIRGALLVGVTF